MTLELPEWYCPLITIFTVSWKLREEQYFENIIIIFQTAIDYTKLVSTNLTWKVCYIEVKSPKFPSVLLDDN